MIICHYPRVNDYRNAKDEQAWDGFPGIKLDLDLTKLHAAISETNRVFLSVARFGPALKSGSVTIESINPEVFTGFRRAVFFMPNAFYRAGSVVLANNGYHYTAVDITSGPTIVGDNRWFTIVGQGNGSPVTDDNFRDLQDPAKARGYLGIRTMALQDVGTEITEFRTNIENDGRYLRRSRNLADLLDPQQFIVNLGMSDFAFSNLVTDLTGPRGLFGRPSGSGDVVPLTAGQGLTLSSGVLRHAQADVDDLTPGHDGVLMPDDFRVVLNREAFGFVGVEVIPGSVFGALRLDRYARVRHAPPTATVQPTLSPGAWRTRPLSECSSIRTGAELDGMRVFLPAGAFLVEFNTASYASSGPVSSRTRFRRVSTVEDGVEVAGPGPEVIGTCAYDENAGLSIQDEGCGLIISDRPGYYELQQRVSAPVIAGQPVNLDTARAGARELYSEVRIFRLDGSDDATYGAFTFVDKVYKVGSSTVVHAFNPVGRHHVYKVGSSTVVHAFNPVGRHHVYKVGAVAVLEPEE